MISVDLYDGIEPYFVPYTDKANKVPNKVLDQRSRRTSLTPGITEYRCQSSVARHPLPVQL